MMATAHLIFRNAAPYMYELDLPIDYEPTPDRSFGARAAAAG